MQSSADRTMRSALDYLSSPRTYPDRPATIEIVETHFAWVFLSRTLVYKLKKPIRFRELDLTTLAARRASCELEVTLNRRLTEDVYIGVVPLGRSGSGWQLESATDPVDWLVKMRRLPAERMLDRAAREGAVSEDDLVRVLDKLGAYYARAVRAPWTGAEYRQSLTAAIESHGRELCAPAFGLDAARVRALTSAQLACVREHGRQLDARIAAGRVVDAHGDLRPEHICLGPEVQIIDCLEFSAELRLLDTAEEIAFLALECDRLGRPALAKGIVGIYRARCGDDIQPDLLALYRSTRALIRALLAILRTADNGAGDSAGWRARANWYLDAAQAAIAPPDSRKPRSAAT